MRKGTFSVQTANPNSSKHNSRELAPKYLIDSSANNYYELITPDNEFKNIAQNIYKEKIKQTMQKKQVDNLIQETVLTLRPEQNENDVKDLFKKLNKKYGGHELLELAIHRDEGYFLKDDIAYYPTKNILKKDDDWYICSNTTIEKPTKEDFDTKVNIDEFEKVYNYHAHAKFSMFDRETGKTARMQKKDMSERIKFVSNHLKLEYNPSADRHIKKSVNQVKDEHLAKARTMEHNKTLEKELLATKEQLQKASNQLRSFMKETGGFKKEDYDILNKEKKLLEEKLKAKTLTEKELLEKFQKLEENFKTTLAQKEKFLGNLQEIGKEVAKEVPIKEIKEIPNAVKTVLNQNKSLEALKSDLEYKVTTLEEKIVSRANMTAPQPPKDVQKEFELIKKEEFEEKSIKTGLFQTEKIKVLKPDSNILQRTWNLVNEKYNELRNKYNDLVAKFKDLKEENTVLKEKVASLELDLLVEKSEKESIREERNQAQKEIAVEKREARKGDKSDSSTIQIEKKDTQSELRKMSERKKENDKSFAMKKMEEVQRKIQEEKREEITPKKKSNFRSR